MIAAYTRVSKTSYMGVGNFVALKRFRPLEVVLHLERIRYKKISRGLDPFGFLGVGVSHHV